MADRAEKSRRDRREPHPLAVLAGVLAAFLLLAACYVGYQALHILFPQNVYETALPATVSDNVEADGVLLFDEVYVSGSGTLGYLAADGERVSAGTAVAEIYSDASQAVLRQQLTQLTEQIDLLQRSQNTTSLQLDALLRERSAALYDMMDELDAGAYDEVSSGANAYLLAQNKLWIATGDSANFTDQVTALTQQAQSVQAQLGNPTQITAPQTGYFVRASSSGRLNAGADDILAQDPAQLKAYLDSNPTLPLDGCAGKIVSGFTWRYVGVCSAEQGQKLLGQNGKPLSSSVQIRFPGQTDRSFKATVSEVTIDEEQGLALCAHLQRHQRRCALPEPRSSPHLGGGEHRPAHPGFGGALPQGGRHRGRDAGRKLHPRRVRQVRQHRPLLQDRPRGQRSSAGDRR